MEGKYLKARKQKKFEQLSHYIFFAGWKNSHLGDNLPTIFFCLP